MYIKLFFVKITNITNKLYFSQQQALELALDRAEVRRDWLNIEIVLTDQTQF